MKHVVILAHPRRHSFTSAMAARYASTARDLGHEVLTRDLYAMDFDPRLKASELPDGQGFQPAPDVVEERARLEGADVIALFYPLWFNAPPAILKGYFDRVFIMGFGFTPSFGGTEPNLTGTRLISFTASGAPDHWVRETGALDALTTLFDRHVAGVCGLSVLNHRHFGGVTPGIRKDAVEDMLAEVEADVRRFFG